MWTRAGMWMADTTAVGAVGTSGVVLGAKSAGNGAGIKLACGGSVVVDGDARLDVMAEGWVAVDLSELQTGRAPDVGTSHPRITNANKTAQTTTQQATQQHKDRGGSARELGKEGMSMDAKADINWRQTTANTETEQQKAT